MPKERVGALGDAEAVAARFVEAARAFGGGQMQSAVGEHDAFIGAAVAGKHGTEADGVLQIGEQPRVSRDTVQKTRVAILRLTSLPFLAFALGGGRRDIVACGQEAGAVHVQRRGHEALDRFVQRHLEHPLQNQPQQDVSHRRIAHLAAGRAGQRTAQDNAQRITAVRRFIRKQKVRRDAGRLRKEA